MTNKSVDIRCDCDYNISHDYNINFKLFSHIYVIIKINKFSYKISNIIEFRGSHFFLRTTYVYY